MAIDNKDKKVLKSSIEREQNEVACSAECEKIKGSKNLNVPHLRFPEFSGEWKKCIIQDYGEVITGNTPPTNNAEYYNNGSYSWASPADLGTGKKINDTKTKLSESGFKKTRIIPKGSILVTCIGSTIGKIGMAVETMSSNQQINSIIVNEKSNNDFVYYAISRAFPRYLSEVGVQAVPILSKSNFEKLPNYTTSIEEQDKTGYFLNLLDERIATQNKIIDKLQSLIKGISNKIFATIQGIEYRMGNIVTISNGNSNVQDAVTESKDGLYPFFDRSEDIKYLPTFLFDKEAIIYPGEGAEFMPRYFRGKFALHQRCYAIFDFKEIINAQFLYFYLKTQNSYFVRNAVGSTVPSLRLDTFQKLKVIIPPKKIQHSVSLCLSSMEQKCNVEKDILQKLLKQKQYLLRQMFI
ncbi:restriction endonuclease subunit S [uncultured Barnesiella sp.]|uniref:restriction endonuclease subunit S n=2 Tax=Bacteroidales TaxID=171549 RepID=UPI0025979083|nr:restriction endonuclease subunit S [uncultured Barnesiella sp.]